MALPQVQISTTFKSVESLGTPSLCAILPSSLFTMPILKIKNDPHRQLWDFAGGFFPRHYILIFCFSTEFFHKLKPEVKGITVLGLFEISPKNRSAKKCSREKEFSNIILRKPTKPALWQGCTPRGFCKLLSWVTEPLPKT